MTLRILKFDTLNYNNIITLNYCNANNNINCDIWYKTYNSMIQVILQINNIKLIKCTPTKYIFDLSAQPNIIKILYMCEEKILNQLKNYLIKHSIKGQYNFCSMLGNNGILELNIHPHIQYYNHNKRNIDENQL